MRAEPKHPYAGKRCALTTMHAKAPAIAPPLAETVGLVITPVTHIDTDGLGTFSGEVPRPGTTLETAIAKARLGMAHVGLPLGIASEGSFGPHPLVPFLAASTELIVLVDDDSGLTIHESLQSERTNFAALTLRPGDRAIDRFVADAGFPGHALIVRPNAGDGAIRKGITDPGVLHEAIADAARQSADGQARVETDMRAHFNPTRMTEIGRLAAAFAERIACLCPACGAPGFGVVRTEPGLPCAECDTPTGLVRTIVSGCVRCDYQTTAGRPDGLKAASPANCPECNP
jgi:hypothetical protein